MTNKQRQQIARYCTVKHQEFKIYQKKIRHTLC